MNKKSFDDLIFGEENNLLKVKHNFLGEDVYAYFTTKNGGSSLGSWTGLNTSFMVGDNKEDVRKNRKEVARKLKQSLESFVFADQIHGVASMKITKENLNQTNKEQEAGIRNTDCLYTYEEDINLACFFADCTPIYFSESQAGIIGIIHAGWQGTEKLILKNVLEKLEREEKIDLTKIKIVLGPSIKKDSFEVDEDVQRKFAKHQDLNLEKIIFTNGSKWNIDTCEFNYQLAIACGVLDENIKITSIDTYKELELYSFRREGKTGRMLGVIGKSLRRS